ncbi:pre-rRNA-processing protein TSR1 homolog [Cyclospora cayetanensis]|uniref:Duf663 domain-containing protein n=2 Tax=Cyclospora cayetanensis TaxID=88456 RepID=A0A1D3CW33_9EIME|nr:pre-rRNA-processing protein TSR1 homolog [Cyclospora cayetanensis]OEH75407.1 duf663 domain-containing protein [Cyclospora cayetanensis]
MGHRHRSSLKQHNKAFKGSSSKPKSLKEKRKAAAANALALSANRGVTKAGRLQQSKRRRLQQLRDLHQKRAASSEGPPPKVILLLPFSDAVSVDKVFHALAQELLSNDANSAVEAAPEILSMEEDGPPSINSAALESSAAPLEQHSRYLYTLPAYARNPMIPKKHQQQILMVPAPRICASGSERESSMHHEGASPERPSELLRYMDLCSSCDVLVCLFGGHCSYENSAFSEQGYKVLKALKLQGLPPSVIGIGCTDAAVLEPGRAVEGKGAVTESTKFMRRFFESEFGAERKFFGVGASTDWSSVLRAFGAAASVEQVNLQEKSISKRAEAAAFRQRGHLLALSWRVAWHRLSSDAATEPEPCLEVSGLVRGAGLTCKLPVHITGVGDFVLTRIEAIESSAPKRREPAGLADSAARNSETLGTDLQGVVEASQPLQPLDMAAMEQTWPTAEEICGEDRASEPSRRRVRVPKNVGDYERAWLESDTDGSHYGSGDEEQMHSGDEIQVEDGIASDSQPAPLSHTPDDVDDDWKLLESAEQHSMREDNEAYATQRREAAEMEKDFPDQMDTPLDIPAKERFQKYRGLKSFRSSPWAKNEDLPLEYGRIIEVSSLKGLARYAHRAHAELCQVSSGFAGRFCRLWLPLRHSYVLRQMVQQQQPQLEGSDLDNALITAMGCRLANRFAVSSLNNTGPPPCASADGDLMLPDFLLLSQLLQHESQVAVVHSQVTFCDEEALKGKDPVLMACGFRRFPASPIYSEEPRQGIRSAAKWKLKRWAEPGATLTATVYAPLVLPPSPCIMLRSEKTASDGVRVSAWGSVLPANKASSRLIIKRVLLSGHPFKVHRRKAVVRFMFFNPDDVRWFTPIELHTKKGLRGNIVEPLGTHGYMKCKFNDYLKQNDEVLLPLYRRVFPKWYPESWGGSPNQQPMD